MEFEKESSAVRFKKPVQRVERILVVIDLKIFDCKVECVLQERNQLRDRLWPVGLGQLANSGCARQLVMLCGCVQGTFLSWLIDRSVLMPVVWPSTMF